MPSFLGRCAAEALLRGSFGRPFTQPDLPRQSAIDANALNGVRRRG
jgi:hypothetical protein